LGIGGINCGDRGVCPESDQITLIGV